MKACCQFKRPAEDLLEGCCAEAESKTREGVVEMVESMQLCQKIQDA